MRKNNLYISTLFLCGALSLFSCRDRVADWLRTSPSDIVQASTPIIDSITPVTARAGQVVTLHGDHFSPIAAKDTVMFGNTIAVVLAASRKSLDVEIPPTLSAGSIQVNVTVFGKTSTNIPFNVAEDPAPTIESITPVREKPGRKIKIIGKNFSVITTDNVVKFGSEISPSDLTDPNTLEVTVPSTMPPGNVDVTVTTKGKVSNAVAFTVLASIDLYSDSLNRADVPTYVDPTTNPNPIGGDWTVVMGQFLLESGRLSTHVGGQGYLAFHPAGVNLASGGGASYTISGEIESSSGSFGGFIFHVQPDGQHFYLVRISGDLVQFLRTSDGLTNFDRVLLSANVPGLSAGVNYRIEVSSSEVGKFHVKVTDVNGGQSVEQDISDDTGPFIGGAVGFYYGAFAAPVNIYLDNITIAQK